MGIVNHRDPAARHIVEERHGVLTILLLEEQQRLKEQEPVVIPLCAILHEDHHPRQQALHGQQALFQISRHGGGQPRSEAADRKPEPSPDLLVPRNDQDVSSHGPC
jgi:hypothetical protein